MKPCMYLSTKRLVGSLLSPQLRCQYATSSSALPFKIPEPIERSPTALLEALSETVGVDVTAPHFAFIDDPVTIPTSYNKKKHYYLCKEFGKRAARQLAEEWPTLFMFDRDQPRLPAFRPEKALDPLVVEPNDTNLAKMISNKEVEDAVKLYERSRADNIEISEETELDLFYLVCYYNGKNVPISELVEWHGLRNFFEGNAPSTPSDNSIVELLFETVKKTSEVYSAMICNLLKFNMSKSSVARARSLYQEMLKLKYVPSEEVFNYFLRLGVSIDENANTFNVVSVLNEMAKRGVRPSVCTFNASLSALLKNENAWKPAMCLIAEMEACSIKPNLSTFSLLLQLATKQFKDDLGICLGVLDSILQELESFESIELSEFTDEQFFLDAMKLAANSRNLVFVERVERLFADKKNKVLFSSFTPETDFYGLSLNVKFHNMTVEEFEEVYVAYIPRITSLRASFARQIIEKLVKYPKWSFTKRLIEDCIAVGYASQKPMMESWQNILRNYPLQLLTEKEQDECNALLKRLISIENELEFVAEKAQDTNYDEKTESVAPGNKD